MWYKSTGRLVYDPRRPGMKKRTEWWAVVLVDKEITRYYRWWIKKNPWNFGETDVDIKQPSWDAHISVIRGEKPEPELMDLWKKYENETVEFWYDGLVRRSGDTTGNDRPDHYFFVEIQCPRIIEIRKELNRPVDWKLHLTVGRTY